MAYIGTTQRVQEAMRQLQSVITREIDCRNEDSFLNRALKFVQTVNSTLKQIEQMTNKKWNVLLDSILLTAGLVAQNLSSETAFNAVSWVSQEIGGFFNGSVPENMTHNFDELQRLLAAASAKMTKIQASCYWLMEQVMKACESYFCSRQTVPRLEAYRLGTSADIRDCEQTVLDAHGIIEKLHETAERQAVKLGLGLALTAVFTLAFGFCTANTIQAGNRIRAGIYGCAGVGCAVLCYFIAKKLGDYKVVWEKVNIRRNQYRQISTRLESLKAMVEREMQRGLQLITGMPNLETTVIIILLVAFGGVLMANLFVVR